VDPAILLAAAGNHTFAGLLEEFLESDGSLAGRFWMVYGGFQTNSYWVYLDVGRALVTVSQRWPDQLLTKLTPTSPLRRDAAVLRVLGGLDRADARDILYTTVRSDDRYGSLRATALQSLVRLRDPRVADLLVQVLGIPDVREAALVAALDGGDARLLGRLRRIVAAASTPPGRREQAYDAIAAISTRAGRPLVPAPPPAWRELVTVPRRPSATVTAQQFQFVRAGAPIIDDGIEGVRAPCDGVIETVDPTLRIRPIPWDPDLFVRELHAVAGTRRHSILLEALPQFGEEACDAIFAHLRADTPTATLRPREDPREIVEALGDQLRMAARTWPDRFLANLRDPSNLPLDLRDDTAALAEIDRPEARERLIHIARHAGTYPRSWAVNALVRVNDPRLPDLLLEYIKDRSGEVRTAAARAAIEVGDPRLLPALHRLARDNNPDVLDAIEAISIRAGHLDIPPLQRRLVEVPAPDPGPATISVVRVLVSRFLSVRAGQDLAEIHIGTEPYWITAPIDGTVRTVLARVGHPLPPVPFRIRPR
jgi:HEAT repeat protein